MAKLSMDELTDRRLHMSQQAAHDRLAALRERTDIMLTPADVAPILGVDAQSLRVQIDADPAALGFHVIHVGRRTMIPRVPFLRYIGAE